MPENIVFLLGPQGTFSSMAGQYFNSEQQYKIECVSTILEIGQKVSQDSGAKGILPIENSTTGVVGLSQDCLLRHDLLIEKALLLKIDFSLLYADQNLNDVVWLHAHQQAYDQCSEFITNELPRHRHIPADSNIHAIKNCLSANAANNAALGPAPFLNNKTMLKGWQIRTNTQNYQQNYTRFIQCRSMPPAPNSFFDFRKKKTSIIAHQDKDAHSNLYSLLKIFHKHGINLTALHSKPNPSETRLWSYAFFIDFENSSASEECMNAIRQDGGMRIKILGTYDTEEIRETITDSVSAVSAIVNY